MSIETNKQAQATENLETSQTPQDEQDGSEDLLKTRVESGTVVNFIENLVQAMGSAAMEQYGGTLAQPVRRPVEPVGRKYQSKAVAAIMQKLERVEKYPDTAKQVVEDQAVQEWLNRSGCKQKEYFDELECAEELTSFFGGHRHFDLALKAASKALAITMLHRRDDDETLAELHWVMAELHAATDKMDLAIESMVKCLALIEPGAGKGHPTYNELLSQLDETRQRSCMVAMA